MMIGSVPFVGHGPEFDCKEQKIAMSNCSINGIKKTVQSDFRVVIKSKTVLKV